LNGDFGSLFIVRPRKNFGNIAEDRAFAKRLINVCRDSIRNVGGVLKSH